MESSKSPTADRRPQRGRARSCHTRPPPSPRITGISRFTARAPKGNLCPTCDSSLLGVYMGMAVDVGIGDLELRYERAFEDHWRTVFRFVLAWTNDWAAAEEIAQEAFVRLWQNRSRIDWSEPVLPWLLVTGRRLAMDRFRAIRRRVLPSRTAPDLDESARDRWIDVQAALARLSGLERTAMVLTLFEGAPTSEVAELLNTTPGAIRAAVSRAREKLEEAR